MDTRLCLYLTYIARPVPDEGVTGILHVANPLDACAPLKNHIPEGEPLVPFVVISRGTCNFDKKVKNAQVAGFQAAIVYNTMDFTDEMITMSGSAEDIDIYAVFVSWNTGQALLGAVGDNNVTCTLQAAAEDTAWSIMAVSSISLLAVSAVLSTFFFVRRHRLRHLGSRFLSREPSGMNARDVQALPTFIFEDAGGDGAATGETCAICLEDYESGQKLRHLPCDHDFHVGCIDQWLLTRRPFCPICKQDANAAPRHQAATETTPLLVPPAGRAVPVPSMSSAATQTSPVGSPGVHTTQSLPANVAGEDLC
ncbi:receptor homology region, transmembrane domain- and RING domain-containing protein 1 isoform X2 [Physcomitrium patens]|uniref:RING-type E3 ubiquitin transferase n=1 Tax=Physcomitrium patens TaxID=3218 RepID=A0A7I4CQ62_PHYPA|nr:receptor homology region, transmembrane domain- and RING domain-containing protein 1-like isoform X2 [Physcomitrium patens]|eukprot:XP_024365613.1 receptor homology region, transmembrane domain- and RING domain-containing protein 1-like isoform X2 [Physcomitrella patens]